jgi:hypothetical protein
MEILMNKSKISKILINFQEPINISKLVKLTQEYDDIHLTGSKNSNEFILFGLSKDIEEIQHKISSTYLNVLFKKESI